MFACIHIYMVLNMSNSDKSCSFVQKNLFLTSSVVCDMRFLANQFSVIMENNVNVLWNEIVHKTKTIPTKSLWTGAGRLYCKNLLGQNCSLASVGFRTKLETRWNEQSYSSDVIVRVCYVAPNMLKLALPKTRVVTRVLNNCVINSN